LDYAKGAPASADGNQKKSRPKAAKAHVHWKVTATLLAFTLTNQRIIARRLRKPPATDAGRALDADSRSCSIAFSTADTTKATDTHLCALEFS
jgi:hypothetical protein